MKEQHDYPSSYYSPRHRRRRRSTSSKPPTPPSASAPSTQAAALPRLTAWIMPTAALLLLGAAAAGAKVALAWPLAHDSPLMHYVVFLMAHGLAPYRDIVDMNMPGTYVLEGAVIHLIGGGPFAWWFYDCLLGLTTILASLWIAGPRRRAVGIAGGTLAYMVHLSDGVPNFGQRDWAVAVFLLVAFGFLFQNIRSRNPLWIMGFTAFSTFAATITPPVAALTILFLIAAAWQNNRPEASTESTPEDTPEPLAETPAKTSLLKLLLYALAGALVPLILCALFLLHWHITQDFLTTLHGLVPWHASLQRIPLTRLLFIATVLRPLMLGAIPLFLLTRSWRRWESTFLAAATLAGAAIFIAQGKGWSYHLYPEIAFAALWGMLELDHALNPTLWSEPSQPQPRVRTLATRTIAILTLLATVLVFSHRLRRAEHAAPYPMDTITDLESDLTSLGSQQLSGHVQCLDMTMGGCINTLYRMQLVQSTGFLYDFYLFPERPNPVTTALQSRFLFQVTAEPPKVFILSSHAWPATETQDESDNTYSYDQLSRWPAFEQFLTTRYTLTREIPKPPDSAGYRIYLLKESSPQPPAHPAATLDHSPQLTSLAPAGTKASAPLPAHTVPTAAPAPTASHPSA